MTFKNLTLKDFEYQNGSLVKVRGARPEYMSGEELLSVLKQFARLKQHESAPAQINKMAYIACCILNAHLTQEEMQRVHDGTNPHDLMDANIALYGAFCAVRFKEPDAGDEDDTAILNAVAEICGWKQWDAEVVKSLL